MQLAAGRDREGQLALRAGEPRGAHLGHDERPRRPEVERVPDREVVERGRGRHRRLAHVVEPSLRFREPGPRPVREAEQPLVPRPLSPVELQTADQSERRSTLVIAVHPEGQHGRRGDQVGDLAVALEVRALAGHRASAVLAHAEARGTESEDDRRSAGRARGLIAAHGSPRASRRTDTCWAWSTARSLSGQGHSSRGRQQ